MLRLIIGQDFIPRHPLLRNPPSSTTLIERFCLAEEEIKLFRPVRVGDQSHVRAAQLKHRLVRTICWPIGRVEPRRGIHVVRKVEPIQGV